MRSFNKDLLKVNIYDTRDEMGRAAASDVKAAILALLEEKAEINMIFAAAPSQNEVLAALACDKEIPWERVHAFHMDEYIGLDRYAPQGFGNFLREHIFGIAPFASVEYIRPDAPDAEAECERYAELLRKNPVDIVVLGIGENGHIAFNDPPFADFDDPKLVKTVKLDEVCRNQQVNDGCFASIDEVPTHAVTLTVPALMAGKQLFCIVPAKTKANAVYATVCGDITEDCPASVMRTHESVTLYLDSDSGALLNV